ncbi:MAG: hypothetical protein OHK93_001147 [Ramalina farinacea]|uniref:Uncharacterized protein n=1 Tax=Ramalina farinacea TaxID=258253 RepID=A0AA43TVX4_9LECA|nr:hypothetical protein [Ramalina farinacea]
MTLGAITVQHLTLAFPANTPGTGNDATIAISNSPLVNATNAFSGAASTYSSVPPVTIKFQNRDRSRGRPPWRPQPGRNETAVAELLARLVGAYSDPTVIGQKLLNPEYEWDQGPAPEVFINMTPQAPEEYEPQDLWLTGKTWSNACKGFQDFLSAYPGLGIYFEVYVLYEPRQEFFAASGVLSVDEQERQQRVDVT